MLASVEELHAGMRFDSIAALQPQGDAVMFYDLDSGLWFICPTSVIFELTGRFSGRSSD